MPAIGKRISVPDTVQGVDQFMVEMAIDTGSGYGAYSELTAVDPTAIPERPYSDIANEYFYDCPSVSVSGESRTWTFLFRYTVAATFTVGNKFKFRFTPSGFDEGSGPAFESNEHTVTAASSVATQDSNKMSMTLANIL